MKSFLCNYASSCQPHGREKHLILQSPPHPNFNLETCNPEKNPHEQKALYSSNTEIKTIKERGIREKKRMERRQQRHANRQVLLLMGILLLSSVERISCLSVTVNDVECVYEYVLYEGDTISGNFVVVDHDIFWSSDHPGIDFIVTSAAGNTVHTLKGTSGDKFEFKAPRNGMYKFCFHNPYSTPETVSFYIHVGHIPNEHDLAKDEHLDPINVKIAELREALESVTAEQKYLKARDARHRHTNESTRKRVIGYTVGEYIFLAVASALQVVYIRRLFSKSVAYNRV